MNHYLIYNGRSSKDLGLRVTCDDPFAAPERVVKPYTVPGRNGTVVEDEAYYNNISRTYRAAAFRAEDPLEQLTSDLKRWLLADGLYHRLEDSYAEDVFRMARVEGPFVSSRVGTSGRSMTMEITFDCKPQKFLKSGDELTGVYSAETGEMRLDNPTGFAALPLIEFQQVVLGEEGRPVIYFHDVDAEGHTVQTARGSVEFLNWPDLPSPKILVDAETTEAVFADTLASANAYVEVDGDISLHAGMTALRLHHELDALCLKIRPRWWRL